jgi:hypothetical protein
MVNKSGYESLLISPNIKVLCDDTEYGIIIGFNESKVNGNYYIFLHSYFDFIVLYSTYIFYLFYSFITNTISIVPLASISNIV